MASPFGNEQDLYYMKQAFKQAQRAYAVGEVPIGAIVVAPDGTIIGRGYNSVERDHTQAAHAEVRAITRAGKHTGDWRLEECWVYVTLEPCSLCMALIMASRISGVVYGARSPLFGYSLDKYGLFQLYKVDTIPVVAGVLAQEAAQLLKDFFTIQRKAQSGRSKK